MAINCGFKNVLRSFASNDLVSLYDISIGMVILHYQTMIFHATDTTLLCVLSVSIRTVCKTSLKTLPARQLRDVILTWTNHKTRFSLPWRKSSHFKCFKPVLDEYLCSWIPIKIHKSKSHRKTSFMFFGKYYSKDSING